MIEVNKAQRDILYILYSYGREGDKSKQLAYGSDIRAEIREYYVKEITPSLLYENLEKLIDEGYVASQRRDGRSKYYALTDKGEQAVEDHHAWKNEIMPDEIELNI